MVGGNDGLIAGLVALRTQAQAMGAQIDALLSMFMDDACRHPPDQRVQVSAGSNEFLCRVCGEMVREGG